MKIQALTFLVSCLLIGACTEKKKSPIQPDIDPDIVLVNIEKGDRAFIGNLIRAVDSCRPAVIAVDAWFVNSKGYEEDSVLVATFKAVPNDIVAYSIDPGMGVKQSHLKFRSFFTGEGVMEYEGDESGIAMQPLFVFNGEVHEAFSLRILRQWKPEFKHNFTKNQSIIVDFKRPLENYLHFDISSVRTHREELKNKVVILGYLGPDNEDKHFTPLRKLKKYPANEPDSYSAVMVANTVRTLLDYK